MSYLALLSYISICLFSTVVNLIPTTHAIHRIAQVPLLNLI